MCCKMKNAAFLKKSKYCCSLIVTVALQLLRLRCSFGGRYLKFIGLWRIFFPLDKDRIKPVFLHGYRNIPLYPVYFLLKKFGHLLVSSIIPF